jgi:hypothetical protein
MTLGNLHEFEVMSGNEVSSAATGTTTTSDEKIQSTETLRMLAWCCPHLANFAMPHRHQKLSLGEGRRTSIKPCAAVISRNREASCRLNIVNCMSDRRRGFDWWLDLLIALTHYSWLHFTVQCYTHTHTHTLLFSVCYSLQQSLPGNGYYRWRFFSIPYSRRYCPANFPLHLGKQQYQSDVSFR